MIGCYGDSVFCLYHRSAVPEQRGLGGAGGYTANPDIFYPSRGRQWIHWTKKLDTSYPGHLARMTKNRSFPHCVPLVADSQRTSGIGIAISREEKDAPVEEGMVS
jgi:hypothetical protein